MPTLRSREGQDLSFAEQDLHAVEELGQRAGQTEGQDPVHHHQQLGGNIWTLATWFSSSPHIRERMTKQDINHENQSHGTMFQFNTEPVVRNLLALTLFLFKRNAVRNLPQFQVHIGQVLS